MPKPAIRSIVFAVALFLAVTGVLLYRHASAPESATATQASLRRLPADACLDFAKTPSSSADIKAMQARARELADASHYDQALAQYRSIAEQDPGLPGLNLEISRMLLKLGQPRLAKEAINTQIEVSECLPHLPLDSMDEYCKSHNFPSTLACVKQLNSDQQSAYLQAASIQMELGRGLSHEPSVDASAAAPTLKAAPHQAHAAVTTNKPANTLVASRATPAETQPKPVRHPNPNQLASGTGTDAALGAYSK